jgi:hypothetical protein
MTLFLYKLLLKNRGMMSKRGYMSSKKSFSVFPMGQRDYDLSPWDARRTALLWKVQSGPADRLAFGR